MFPIPLACTGVHWRAPGLTVELKTCCRVDKRKKNKNKKKKRQKEKEREYYIITKNESGVEFIIFFRNLNHSTHFTTLYPRTEDSHILLYDHGSWFHFRKNLHHMIAYHFSIFNFISYLLFYPMRTREQNTRDSTRSETRSVGLPNRIPLFHRGCKQRHFLTKILVSRQMLFPQNIYLSSAHSFSLRMAASSSGLKSLTMLNVFLNSSGDLCLIISAIILQPASKRGLMFK